MKRSLLTVAGLIALTLAGCRTDPGVALLERQNRLLEDEIYRLRGVIQDYEDGLTPGCTVTEAVQSAPAETVIEERRESAAGPLKSYDPRTRKTPSRQTVQPPIVELPGEAQPPGEIPDTLKRPAGTKLHSEPGRSEEHTSELQS